MATPKKGNGKKPKPSSEDPPAEIGRPSDYDRIILDQVLTLARRGFTNAEMAEFFGVAQSTWYLWQRLHPEFSETLKLGKEEADQKVVQSLFERATGFSHGSEEIHFDKFGNVTRAPVIKEYPPDTVAAIFWLKNRQPDKWREKIEQEHRFPEPLVLKSQDGTVRAVLGSA